MTRIIDTPKALLVEVPEGSKNFTIIQSHSYFNSPRLEHSIGGVDLPTKYSYGQPILAGEMSEEEWKKVVEWYEDSNDSSDDPQYNETTYFPVIHDYETGDDDGCETFAESGQSLLRSHNLKPETTVVIPKL